MEERVITVPLKNAKREHGKEKADRAMKEIRSELSRHFRTAEEDVNLDPSINRYIWSRGGSKIPSKAKIRAAKFDDGVVEAEIAD